MTTAMILAAGFGTRLRPLTEELPKPLVWVGDRPAIAHIGERIGEAGISEIVVNTHHRADAFSSEVLSSIEARISVVTEPEILGTGGGLANAAPLLGDGDVVVWNGDILAPIDVAALLREHRGGATLCVAPRSRGDGTVGLDEEGRIVRLRGERFGEELSGGDFVGISVIGSELRHLLPREGCLVGDGLLPWLRSGREVHSFAAATEWDDIGSLSTYVSANRRWLSASGRDAYLGPGAKVEEGVRITGSVVGKGATIRGTGSLDGCVVWPGAVATAPLLNTVVTTGGLSVQVTPARTSLS